MSGLVGRGKSEWQGFVHPVVVTQHLLAAETGLALGQILGKVDQALRADGTPGLSQFRGVANEDT